MNTRSANRSLPPVAVFALLGFVLALRVVHLSSALQSPLSYQPGPDEEYYRAFGTAVAAGRAGDAVFTFMDPGYGYLLGAAFRLFGVNPFAVYLLQSLLDVATAYGILLIGRLLGRPRAGLYGALLYGVTSTAIMFCAALLKETCVAAYVTWWVVGALAVARHDKAWQWLSFGVYCGCGIALRSTLALLCVPALLLPRRARSLLVLAGIAVAALPWAVRNFEAVGVFSPLPHNGGIVLHQAYNPDNPRGELWIPAFVNYADPGEIWRGYAAEAERRAGHPLTPPAVDAYWRGQALGFVREHPGDAVREIARKSLSFLASSEIPNNRSAREERLFSPVLAVLPAPMPWLLALGLAGLAWFAWADRRWLLLAAPIALAWCSMAVFWPEDRFRFHAVPVLAFAAGIFIDQLVLHARTARREVGGFVLLAAAIAALSFHLGDRYPAPPVRWDHIVWGYINMGKPREALEAARVGVREHPDDGPILEALGYLAASTGAYTEALGYFKRAIAARPRSYIAHFDLAKTLLALGRRPQAAAEAAIAQQLHPSADAAALVQAINAQP